MFNKNYKISLDLKIVPKKRHRYAIRNDINKVFGVKVNTFTPKETKAFEDLVGLKVRRFMVDNGLEIAPKEPVELSIKFNLAITGNKNKNYHFMVKKPDLDNLAKSVMDSVNKIMYYDDSYVVKLTTEKHYSKNENENIEINFKYLREKCQCEKCINKKDITK